MTVAFVILSALTLGGAVGAVCLRNPVHCVLSLILAFVGLAGHYLRLNAQFVGLAQLLVYVGAVGILIVFAILLTRCGTQAAASRWSSKAFVGGGIAAGMFVLIAIAVLRSETLSRPLAPPPETTVRQIGESLMTTYVLPLEAAGVLLTAALIAAVVLALPFRNKHGGTEP